MKVIVAIVFLFVMLVAASGCSTHHSVCMANKIGNHTR